MKLQNRRQFNGSASNPKPSTLGWKYKTTKWMYYFVLLIILAYMGFYTYKRFNYVITVGTIHQSKLTLKSPISGTTSSFNVTPNTDIKSGTLITEIIEKGTPSNSLISEKMKSELRLNKLRIELIQLTKSLSLLKEELKVSSGLLLEIQTINQNQIDRLENNIQQHYLDIASTKKLITLKEQHLNNLATKIDVHSERPRYTLKSPINGTIDELLVADNEFVVTGQPVLTILEEQSKIWIDSFIPLASFSKFTIGQSANAKLNHSDYTFPVKIVEIMPEKSSFLRQSSTSAKKVLVRLKPINEVDFSALKEAVGYTVTLKFEI